MEPERRYALDALLDALGLPFDEGAPATADELDETFALLTLASEREAELDAHGRPLPPQAPQGPRLAELATALGERLGVERRGYPGGERFVIALTHDVDLLGAGGARTAARKLAGGIVHRSTPAPARGHRVRARRAPRPRSGLPVGGDARCRGGPRLDLLLPHAPGRPARRLSGALSPCPRGRRSSERRPPAARSPCTPPTGLASGREGSPRRRRRSPVRRASGTTICAAPPSAWPPSCARQGFATTPASAGRRSPGCVPGRRTRIASGTPSAVSRAAGSFPSR